MSDLSPSVGDLNRCAALSSVLDFLVLFPRDDTDGIRTLGRSSTSLSEAALVQMDLEDCSVQDTFLGTLDCSGFEE